MLLEEYVKSTHAKTHTLYTLDIENIFQVSLEGGRSSARGGAGPQRGRGQGLSEGGGQGPAPLRSYSRWVIMYFYVLNIGSINLHPLTRWRDMVNKKCTIPSPACTTDSSCGMGLELVTLRVFCPKGWELPLQRHQLPVTCLVGEVGKIFFGKSSNRYNFNEHSKDYNLLYTTFAIR